MATYLHQLPAELLLQITDYLSSVNKQKLSKDLITQREEYLCKLINPDFYKDILFPLKKYIYINDTWWYYIRNHIKVLISFFDEINTSDRKYKIRDIIFGDGYISGLHISIRFVLVMQLYPELSSLHIDLSIDNLSIIDLYSTSMFSIKFVGIYNRISRVEKNTQKTVDIILSIFDLLKLNISLTKKDLLELWNQVSKIMFNKLLAYANSKKMDYYFGNEIRKKIIKNTSLFKLIQNSKHAYIDKIINT